MKLIIKNIPNILSLYRLLMFPFLLFLIIQGNSDLFIVLFSINLITDILDGFIARKFNLSSDFGAKLDSMADFGSFILAFTALINFHPYLFEGSSLKWIIAYSATYITYTLISQIKYGRPATGLHLWSSKIAGYFQGIFILSLFVIGFNPTYFYITMLIGIISLVECIVINILSSVPILNAKTIYHSITEGRINNG